MKSRKWVVVLTCTALVLSGLSGWLIAGEREFEDDDREEVAEMLAVFEVLVSGLVTPAAALETAAKTCGGAAFEMELAAVRADDGKRVAWEVEFLQDGKLVEVLVDAKTGQVIGSEKETDAEEAAAIGALLERKPMRLAAILGKLSTSLAGSITKIELDDEDDGVFWEAVVLHSGRMAEVVVEGATGKIIPGADDDDDDDEAEKGEDD